MLHDVPTGRRSEARPLRGFRVLVVEDEYFIAHDLEAALEELGAVVIGPVPTCAEALRHVAGSGRIHLAVLDINLQGATAFPVADALASHGVPFVFATGYESGGVPKRFAHVARWEKPFDAEALARSLRTVGLAPH